MLLLLPPSETKRVGGVDGTRLDLGSLAFPALTRSRRAALTALRALSTNVEASMRALKLGATLRDEALRNRVVSRSPVLPAIDRYEGVLYDALDAATLSGPARAFAHEHVVIASALFGLTAALDPIPAYRLSADSRLPGLPLVAHWRDAVAGILADRSGLLLDLRSEVYAALGPLPPRDDAVFVRVVTEGDDGRRRTLNHFNKHGKGAFTRAVLEAGIDHPDVSSLLAWAADAGWRLEPGARRELDLVV